MSVEIASFFLSGVLIGAVTGLTPGLHVNTLVLLLASAVDSSVAGVAVVAAALTHSFLDVVPSVAVGVPDDSMALAALPGHEMVLEGRGREAIRLSAAGSMIAVAFGVALVLPISVSMTWIYPYVEGVMAWILSGIALYLVATEKGGMRSRFTSLWLFFASGVLGYYVLEGVSETGDMLMPLFTGLFGIPLLVASFLTDADIPRQSQVRSLLGRRRVVIDGFGGSVAGAVVGWIPGASPAVATTLVQTFLPDSETERRARRSFVTAVSGVNTSNALYAIVALYFIGRERSGVAVALSRLGETTQQYIALYITVAATASLTAFLITLTAEKHVFRVIRKLNYRYLTASILALLTVLTVTISGLRGLPLLAAATVVGFVPSYTEVRRVHCMGSLMLPLIIFYI